MDSMTFFIESDALQNNFEQVKASVDAAIRTQALEYDLIINNFLTKSFDDGIFQAERELGVGRGTLVNADSSRQRDIIIQNAVNLKNELMASIEKEVTAFLTNIEVNSIKFTNAGLKREISQIFANKQARLISQVVTETGRATNVALESAYKASGVITHKMWVAVIDDRTTSICLNGNGEVVPIGQAFSTGDFGAPFHINCRSRIVGLTLQQANLATS